ncbi:alpha/beta hydrolase [Natronospora cellulosivora (SeqCode)]
MNEASSKFVDNIAVEKLLNEKLNKVSHSLEESHFTGEYISFEDLSNQSIKISNISYTRDEAYHFYKIPSFETNPYYLENNNIYLYRHLSNKPICNILFLHGLYDDNLSNYDYLFRLLNNLGFNVYLMVLPYHFKRKPVDSIFSGEFFLSADIYRTKNAYKQAIYDIEASLQVIDYINSLPTILIGFSMGGSITLRYYSLRNQLLSALFLINPVTNLLKVVWDNSLLVPISNDIKKSGFDATITQVVLQELDPCLNLPSDFKNEAIALAYSRYDQIIEEKKYQLFIERAGLENVFSYYAGHLNILRVPKLSKNIFDFFLQSNN